MASLNVKSRVRKYKGWYDAANALQHRADVKQRTQTTLQHGCSKGPLSVASSESPNQTLQRLLPWRVASQLRVMASRARSTF
jgi:hypothetical protein